MVFGPPPPVKRGRISPEEKIEIERVIGSMKKPTAGKVARRVNRHPATINWYMLTKGHIEREPGRAPGPYVRAGKIIYPYAPEHDAFIQELRRAGLSKKIIAARLTAEFGIARSHHSVDVRLVQLAAAPQD